MHVLFNLLKGLYNLNSNSNRIKKKHLASLGYRKKSNKLSIPDRSNRSELNSAYAVFHWQNFATNRQKSVNSIGPLKNPPMEMTDFERFVAKICQRKTALVIYIYEAQCVCVCMSVFIFTQSPHKLLML